MQDAEVRDFLDDPQNAALLPLKRVKPAKKRTELARPDMTRLGGSKAMLGKYAKKKKS